MEVAYNVVDLTKKYPGPKEVLANDHINLRIEIGEIVGIFGPNGAGKTTLVRQLAGLLRPTSGQIWLFGHDLVRKPTLATHYVAYFAQETYYFWYLKPYEVLTITGRLRGMRSKEARIQANLLLERFNLRALERRTLSQLSLGQARFVTLLSVFMANRPILILDEPTNDLDPLHRRAFWDYLWEVNSKEGVTVLLVTHNVHEAEQAVHRVLIIDAGRIIASGTPQQLKQGLEDIVRIEITLSGDSQPRIDYEMLQFKHCQRLPSKRNTILLRAQRANVNEVVQEVYNQIGSQAIADLRIVSPTLEDVYVQAVGKEWL